jgi:hypothetical protein
VPALADLALRAGDFLAAEIVAGVALLGAVLADGVAGQRPGEGDLVLAPGPLHVDQGDVAAVDPAVGSQRGGALLGGLAGPNRWAADPGYAAKIDRIAGQVTGAA